MTPATPSTNSTSRSATSSRARGVRAALALVALGVIAAGSAGAKVFLTVEEGLALAFPDCRIDKRTVFLTEEQKTRAGTLAGTPVESAVVHPYEAVCDNQAKGGVAFLDTHRVRTLAETLLVVVDAAGKLRRLEVLAFREPEEYLPRSIWYQQFAGRPLAPELALKRDIRGVTGATLTAHATTDAVRRVLALHRVLYLEAAAPGAAR